MNNRFFLREVEIQSYGKKTDAIVQAYLSCAEKKPPPTTISFGSLVFFGDVFKGKIIKKENMTVQKPHTLNIGHIYLFQKCRTSIKWEGCPSANFMGNLVPLRFLPYFGAIRQRSVDVDSALPCSSLILHSSPGIIRTCKRDKLNKSANPMFFIQYVNTTRVSPDACTTGEKK